MKINELLFSLIVLLFICCKNQKSQEIEIQELPNSESSCITKVDKEQALESILKTEYFVMHLHPELDERLPITLLKNDFITGDLSISWNQYKVLFADSLILPRGKVIELKIDSLDCEEMKFFYQLYYPIEGSLIKGSTVKQDSIWISRVYRSVELEFEPDY